MKQTRWINNASKEQHYVLVEKYPRALNIVYNMVILMACVLLLIFVVVIFQTKTV